MQNCKKLSRGSCALGEHEDLFLKHIVYSASTNFSASLPAPQSDLARQTLKNPYIFNFLAIRDKHDERELEDALVGQVTKFLLELGAGFSFIGSQYKLTVDDEDFYIDLLFYHVKLYCYVVVELKTLAFKPEFAGKLNFLPEIKFTKRDG